MREVSDMAEETSQEKTEEPTEKRKQDSRDKGQVPRSKELNTVVSLLASTFGIMILGGQLLEGLALQMSSLLVIRPDQLAEPTLILEVSGDALRTSVWMLIPILSVALLSAFFGPVVMGGWMFQFSSLAPKLEKLNPVKGLGKIFSVQGLMELLKALAKFVLVVTVSAAFIYFSLKKILSFGLQPPASSLVHAGNLIETSLLVMTSVLILVAVIDVPFQLFQFKQKIRMTKQEVKDEMKETDGRPEVKSRIRALQQEIAKRSMMEDLKDADVVITNPTHFAVALKYSDDSSLAPVVVAKGRDLLALQIIERAGEYDITVFQAPPLARALYASTDLQQEIPATLYVAVAQVLAYVFQLRNLPPWERAQLEVPKVPGTFDENQDV